MKTSKIIRPNLKAWQEENVLKMWHEKIPLEWRVEGSFDEFLKSVDNLTWMGRSQRSSDNATFFYAYDDHDFTDINWMINHIALREDELIARGFDVSGVKSFNRNTWVDMARESGAMEGILEDFSYDLLDFRAQLRGKIAHDPSTKDFDIDIYFLKLLDQYRKVLEHNDSVLVTGKNKEFKLSIETARHFIAFKYAYKCAKKYRNKNLTAIEVAKIIQNIAGLLSGNDWVAYRTIQVYVNKNGNYDLAKWTPVKHEKIIPCMDALCEWIANCDNINPIDKAAIAQAEFIRIHPYLDGNGRTGRILSNFILMLSGLPTIQIRHQNTIEYFKATNKAIETHKADALINMFHEQVLDSAKKIALCLDYIEENQQVVSKEPDEKTK